MPGDLSAPARAGSPAGRLAQPPQTGAPSPSIIPAEVMSCTSSILVSNRPEPQRALAISRMSQAIRVEPSTLLLLNASCRSALSGGWLLSTGALASHEDDDQQHNGRGHHSGDEGHSGEWLSSSLARNHRAISEDR